jgi:hypothetical protein
MKKFERLWEEIEENFPWKRVYKAMKATDWHWAFDVRSNEKNGIPTVSALKAEGKRLAMEAYQREMSLGTGGLMATYSSGVLILEFTLAHYEAFPE